MLVFVIRDYSAAAAAYGAILESPCARCEERGPQWSAWRQASLPFQQATAFRRAREFPSTLDQLSGCATRGIVGAILDTSMLCCGRQIDSVCTGSHGRGLALLDLGPAAAVKVFEQLLRLERLS